MTTTHYLANIINTQAWSKYGCGFGNTYGGGYGFSYYNGNGFDFDQDDGTGHIGNVFGDGESPNLRELCA